MPKNKLSEYSSTPGDNTDIGGIFIGENMAPSDVNNAMREQMSQLKEFLDGSSGDTLTSAKIVATTAEILSGVNVTGTATFNSAVILSSSVTGSALSLSGALTVGGATILSSTLGVTGTASMGVIDATSLEVTNIKAKDGTASATIADSTGVMTLASAVLTTADINGGTADNVVIGGATPAAGTFTTGTATTFTATTVDSTNLEVTNLKAKDGTSAGSIADSTGVVTLNSAVLTTADINGGTADNVVIGGGTAAAGTFTTATATTGNITNVNATTVDSTNLEVTNIKAKDGTAAATIADSTGVVTIPSAVLTTADINGGTVDNAAIGAGTPSTGAFTTLSSNSTTTLNGTTIPTSKTLLVSTDIGSTVQAYDDATAKYDDVTANFTGTLQNGGSNVLVDTDIGTNVQAYDAQLADVAGLTPADGAFIVGDGANFVAESGATARTSLGLGSIATQAANSVDIDGGAVDGVTLGTNSAVTEAQIDNVNINGNAIVSSDTDGDLSLTPNGTGDLILDGLKWPQADGTADYVLKTDGSGQLSWTEQTGGGGTPGGSDTQIQYNSGGSFAGASGLVTDGSNLTLNAQGDLRFADSDSSNWVAFQAPTTVASNVTWTLPDADGTDGQVIKTNGSGTLSWITPSAGGGGGGGTSVTVTQATATASQTTFNVTYTVGQLSVYLNGALLASADYTATNGTTVVLSAGAASGDIFTAVAYSTVEGLEIESGSPFMTAVGSGAGAVNTGVNNVFVGFEAGNDNSTGTNNVALGYQALDACTTGSANVAMGANALSALTTTDNCVAIGSGALDANTTGPNNVGIGTDALGVNTTGQDNVAMGRGALSANTTASNNTAIGRLALAANTTGANNTAVGLAALDANTTGGFNTAVGVNALGANTTASQNNAFGYNALAANTTGNALSAFGDFCLDVNTTGSANVGMGQNALGANTTGSNNVAIGVSALLVNTTGADNTAVGYGALDACTTGATHTAIGKNALGACTTSQHNTAIGNGALANCTTGGGNLGVGDRTGEGLTPFNVTTENDRGIFGHTNITNAYVKVAWTVTSDARDKTSIESVPHGLSFVNQLNPVSYRWKTSRKDDTPKGNRRYGFLAQDILAIEGDDPVIIDNEQPDHLKYQGEALVPVLVNAIKELSAKCDSLQAEINTLKGQ